MILRPISLFMICFISWHNVADSATLGNHFSANFGAAAPFSYNHKIGGGAWNDGTNAVTGDIRESLQGGEYACGDVVTYLIKLTIGGVNANDPPATAEIQCSFLAATTGQDGVAHSDVVRVQMNYGAVVNGDSGTGINTGPSGTGIDSAIRDDKGSTVTVVSEVLSPAGTYVFGNPPGTNVADNIILTFRVRAVSYTVRGC
eukprot:jgi/Mesvir1/17203/Mv07621-RA.1